MTDDARLLRLSELARRLDSSQLDVLLKVAEAMTADVAADISPGSDLVTPEFYRRFYSILLAYHADHEEKFNKKSFEYAFREASRASGRSAEIADSGTHSGADLLVEGTPFSLKTEAARGIKEDKITISKLMEARWIRDCAGGQDFERQVKARVLTHLEHYSRIVILRAFDLAEDRIRYDLVEIPHDVLLAIRGLAPADFGDRTANGSSSAVVRIGDRPAFVLRLDGSGEKITVSGLVLDLCVRHASWTIPVLARSQVS